MIEVFPGKGPASRPLATGYLIGRKIAIDSPEGVSYPGPEMAILTHEHCDHIASILSHTCKICASPAAIREIGIGHSFCRELGLPEIRNPKINPLMDGERILSAGYALRIIHTPGHCPGAICIYLEEKAFLFSGDTVFPGLMLPNLSLPGSDPHLLLKSYEKLSKLKIEKFFPGHGEPFSSPGYMERLKEELSALLR